MSWELLRFPTFIVANACPVPDPNGLILSTALQSLIKQHQEPKGNFTGNKRERKDRVSCSERAVPVFENDEGGDIRLDDGMWSYW